MTLTKNRFSLTALPLSAQPFPPLSALQDLTFHHAISAPAAHARRKLKMAASSSSPTTTRTLRTAWRSFSTAMRDPCPFETFSALPSKCSNTSAWCSYLSPSYSSLRYSNPPLIGTQTPPPTPRYSNPTFLGPNPALPALQVNPPLFQSALTLSSSPP